MVKVHGQSRFSFLLIEKKPHSTIRESQRLLPDEHYLKQDLSIFGKISSI